MPQPNAIHRQLTATAPLDEDAAPNRQGYARAARPASTSHEATAKSQPRAAIAFHRINRRSRRQTRTVGVVPSLLKNVACLTLLSWTFIGTVGAAVPDEAKAALAGSAATAVAPTMPAVGDRPSAAASAGGGAPAVPAPSLPANAGATPSPTAATGSGGSGPSSADATPAAKELSSLLKASEKQLQAIENTLLSLREDMSRLRQQVRHPCDEPSLSRSQIMTRVRRDLASRGLSRIELDTGSVPGGGLAQLRLPISIENGKEICVIGYWEIGRTLASLSPSQEAELAPCLADPTLCPELEQYGNAEDSRDEGKTPRTRLRVRVPAHEPWQSGSLAHSDGGVLAPLWQRVFSSPARLNVALYEHRGDDWRLVSTGRLDAPIRGRFTSGLLVLLLVALFYYSVAQAVKRGSNDGSVAADLPIHAARRPKRSDSMPLLERLNPLRITANPFGEASLSNLQFFGFTLLIGSLAFYRWMLTGVLGAFPADLLILLGVSTGSSVAARAVQLRSGLGEAARRDLTRRGWFNGTVKMRRPRLNHLLASGGHFDLSRMQAFVFSLIVAAYVLSSGVIDLGTVKIPTEMLSLMGLSQAIYIAGKAVAPAYVAALEDGVDQLRTLEQQLVDPALSDGQRTTVRQTFDATVRRVAADFSGLYSLEVSEDKLLPWLPATPPSLVPGTSSATYPSAPSPISSAPATTGSSSAAPSPAIASGPEAAAPAPGPTSSTAGP